MKTHHTDEEYQAAIDAACDEQSFASLSLDKLGMSWGQERPLRLALARGLLARLPDPMPPVSVDGKTPGQVAFENFQQRGLTAWSDSSYQTNYEAAASAVLAAFGGQDGQGEGVDWKAKYEEAEKRLREALDCLYECSIQETADSLPNSRRTVHQYDAKAVLDQMAELKTRAEKAEKAEAELRLSEYLYKRVTDALGIEKDILGYVKGLQARAEAAEAKLPHLRPIAEAGGVPGGTKRIFAFLDAGEWRWMQRINSYCTHFADIRLPSPAASQDSQPAEAATFEAHSKTWTRHEKDAPMPKTGGRRIETLFNDGSGSAGPVEKWTWQDTSIPPIGWRYADESTPAPPAPAWQPAVGEANLVQDMALGGQMYWRDLARQLAEVWWKCHNIGASLQHGDIDTDVSFSVVCEQHGGQVFHADTPQNAWFKAEKWLMSPDRVNFPAKEEQP